MPPFIDWNAQRAAFEAEASRIVGRPVAIGGPIAARFLPYPTLELADVSVLGPDGRVLATIDRFAMDVEVAPLAGGEVRAFSVRLDRPVLLLPLGGDGTVTLPVSEPVLPQRVGAVTLEAVTVSDGRVVIEDPARGAITLAGIEGTFAAASGTGTFSGEGSLDGAGERARFDLRGQVNEAKNGASVQLAFDAPSLDARLGFDGSLRLEAGVPRLAGTADLRRPMPAAQPEVARAPADERSLWQRMVDRILWRDEPEAAPVAAPEPRTEEGPSLRAAGRLDATPASAVVTDLRIEAGGAERPYVLAGGGSLNVRAVPSFSLTLQGEPLILEAEGASAPGAPDAPVDPPSFAGRMAVLRSILETVPQPTIPGQVALSLPVVSAGEQAIRNVTLDAAPVAGGWAITNLSAELPGRTVLEAEGAVSVEEGFSFDGHVLLASRQPTGFADWIAGEVDPAIRRLPVAGFDARVHLDERSQRFDDLELNIGGDTVRGRLERASGAAGALVAAEIAGGRVDADALLALSALFEGEKAGLERLDRVDLDLAAGPVTLRGVTAGRIDGRLRYDGKRLDLSSLAIADLAGADLRLNGSVDDPGPEAAGSIELSLKAERPAGFLALLRERLPASPLVEALDRRAGQLGPLDVAGSLSTARDADGASPSLVVRLDGSAGGSRFDLSAALEKGLQARLTGGRFGAELTVDNDSPAVLLRQIGIEAIDAGAPGPLELELSLSASADGPVLASGSLRAPDNELSADGELTLSPSGIAGGELGLTLGSNDLGPWLRTGAVALAPPVSLLPADLAGTASWTDAGWRLADVEGTLAGTALSGELHREGGGDALLGGRLTVSDLSLPWASWLVYGSEPRTVDGSGGFWSEAPFPAGAPSALAGLGRFSVDFQVARLALDPAAVVEEVNGRLDGGDGSLGLVGARGRFAGGTLAGDVEMRRAAGLGGLTLTVEGQGLRATALGLGERLGPDAVLGGTLGIEASGSSISALVRGATGAGRIDLSGARLAGVPAGGLRPILEAADTEGFRLDEAAVADFVSSQAGPGFPLGAVSSQVSVDGGVLRLSPLTIAGPGAMLGVDGRLGLADLSLGASARLAFEAGLDAIEGASPEISYAVGGTLAEPMVSADLQSLTNYLSVRALQREEAEVAALVERARESARLRREVRLFRWRVAEAERAEAERRSAAAAAQQRRIDAVRADTEARVRAQREYDESRRAVPAAPAAAVEAAPAEAPPPAASEEAALPPQAAPVPEPAPLPLSPQAEPAEAAVPAIGNVPTPDERPQPPAAASRPSTSPPATRRRTAPAAPARTPAPAAPPALDFDAAAPRAPAIPPAAPSDFPSLPGVENPLDF
ncbi:AsmA-like C-terminal region-containing protein [Antarcticirhabdus aurantiaca]|uniref:Uncharacterized protein n=1 Tax=Antarcticirhabdus aurantiaca TaxID=2606717 RepID=A0ACD4NI95_9HYPH|nr:hypothetical protein OXU80_16645 [Jeongeuplla avenae]